MKIAVIGAGVVGICTAYELALDGHAVTVFERHAAVAEEASFACAGHQAPSLSHPMAFAPWPQASRLRTWLAPSSIALGRNCSLSDLRWLAGWKSTPKAYLERFAAAQALLSYSQQRQQTLATQAALVFEQSQGQLLIFRSERELTACQERLAALKAQGIVAKVLTPVDARKLEPALGEGVALHSALHFPNDTHGNCRQFAHSLKDRAQEMGVVFHFATPVTALTQSAGLGVQTDALGTQSFDQVVLCAATGAAALLAATPRQLPLTRLWSYSLSAQIREPLNAPRSSVVDGHNRVTISRMGARVRVFGGAELGGSLHSRREATTRLLYQSLQTHFPGAADFGRSMQLWKGASVFSPDALPLLGPSARPGVWLNLAHGHNGWGMACGSARILADLMQGRQADMDTTFVQANRFKS